MTNISIKSEKIIVFGDVFFVLDKIVSTICSYIFLVASPNLLRTYPVATPSLSACFSLAIGLPERTMNVPGPNLQRTQNVYSTYRERTFRLTTPLLDNWQSTMDNGQFLFLKRTFQPSLKKRLGIATNRCQFPIKTFRITILN